MTTNNEHTKEVLNDLILINNDRIVGYEKAIENLDDDDDNNNGDLKNIFSQMVEQSQRCKNELEFKVAELGAEAADGTTNSGKIYRVWMDIKATFTGDDRQTALNNCEFGEDAAQKAYKEALKDADQLNASVTTMLIEQKESLKRSHDTIKDLRDNNKRD